MLAPVRRVQRRLNAVAWAEAGIAPVWVAATVCVVARLLLREAALWAVPLFLVAGGVWWGMRARVRGVSLQQAAVLADRSANAGGLLLTRLERPVGEWELSVNQFAHAVKPPEVRWRRPVGALLGALLFLVVGFLLPLPARTFRPINAAAAAKVAAVQAKAEALAKEEPLGAPMEEELRRLAEEVAEGRFDAADWEASDGLEKRMAERAAEAAAELAGAAEAAKELEDALGASGEAEGASRAREELERALMALGEGAKAPGEGGANGDMSDGGVGPDGQQGTQGSQGSQGSQSAQAKAQAGGNPDQISELRRTLERRQQQLEDRFGQGNPSMRQARGRPGSGRQQGQGKGKGQGQGQEGEGEGEGQSGQSGHASRGVKEGKGAGTGRGGESQPLVFGGEAEMDPDRLKFQALPEGQGGEASELWGLKAADPEREGVMSTPSSIRGTGAQGEATPGHTPAPLLPRNRDLVKRYFGGE
ncbi:hypothetical protein [Hyalangium rubrum]|uniref:Uncharacterized protein n=1 Tax=Hyalangium rubrum TaxID=3103134 RepID=A0ABU5H308_9BACT|nr:hypothetical protein [Hyalangium sp. s54d21]MDY7227484.1 hypothetical protein [Hyalangium sp. s54d21]